MRRSATTEFSSSAMANIPSNSQSSRFTAPSRPRVRLRAATVSNYPGAHEQARKYLDHKDARVRAAAVSGLTSEDVRELLPRLKDMIAKEEDEDTFIAFTDRDYAEQVIEGIHARGGDAAAHETRQGGHGRRARAARSPRGGYEVRPELARHEMTERICVNVFAVQSSNEVKRWHRITAKVF